MDIASFALERWLARHEHGAEINLGDSGVRPLAADRFDTDPGALGYVVPTDGDPALRERVGSWYGRGADEVVFTCGTQEANLLAHLAVLDESSHAVVVTPTYQSLHQLPATLGDVTRVSLDPPDWRLDVDAVEDAIRPETDLVVLNNPNNPTGRVHAPDAVDAVADLAADTDAYFHCDEVYRRLAEDPLDPVADTYDHGISTSGLSKAWGLPGLRFGWLVAPPRVAAAARRWKDYTTIAPPVFGQHIAEQAFDRADEILDENRDHVRGNRALVAEFVDEHGLDWHVPAGATAFVSVPEGVDDAESLCLDLVEAGVVTVPGATFGQPGYLRLGFGVERATLEAGLDRIGSVIDRRGAN